MEGGAPTRERTARLDSGLLSRGLPNGEGDPVGCVFPPRQRVVRPRSAASHSIPIVISTRLERRAFDAQATALSCRDKPIHRSQETARRLRPDEVARPRLDVRPRTRDAVGTPSAGARRHRAQLADDHAERDRDGR